MGIPRCVDCQTALYGTIPEPPRCGQCQKKWQDEQDKQVMNDTAFRILSSAGLLQLDDDTNDEENLDSVER